MIPFDAGAIGGKCRTNAEFYSIYYKQSDFGCQVFCAKVPGGAKGFKFVYANLLFWCAASRFAKPRNFLKKVLIVAVGRCSLRWADSRFAKPRNFPKKVLIVAARSCGCGVLIRGLRNLDAPCEEERVVTFCIVQKVTKKHAGRSPIYPNLKEKSSKKGEKIKQREGEIRSNRGGNTNTHAPNRHAQKCIFT